MKKCHYCGRMNDDGAARCGECGSSVLGVLPESVPAVESHELDSDEIPLSPIAQKDGRAVTLRCRTPGEAFLVCEELEKADILTILPDKAQLRLQFKRCGYVEVRVPAKAYESLSDLRSAVEFQHKRVRADEPLTNFGKLVSMGCAVVIVPGALVFAWLLSSYRKHWYDRMARDLKIWFLLGIAAWLLMAAAAALLSVR